MNGCKHERASRFPVSPLFSLLPLWSLWGVGTCGALGCCLVTIKPDFGLLVDEISPSVGLAYRWLLDHNMMTACSLRFHPALSLVPWGVGACGPQGCCFVT